MIFIIYRYNINFLYVCVILYNKYIGSLYIMNNAINIIFYSRRCGTCNNLFTILKNEDLLKYFKLICVDDKLNILSPQITEVPTMIVKDINRPLIAQDIFKWISSVKFMRQQAMIEANQRAIQYNATLMEKMQNIKNQPMAYINQEMGGFSDGYAYTEADYAQPHSFSMCRDDNSLAIFTAPEQRTIKEDEQNGKIKELERNRNEHDETYKTYMKQQQIQAIIRAEREKLR